LRQSFEIGRLAGIIYLHSRRQDFFNDDLVDLVETLAVQASIALNAASQYQIERERAEALRHRADIMSILTGINYAINFEQPLEQHLRAIGNAIRESTPFQAVLFSVYEPDSGLLRRVTGVGFSQEVLADLLSRKQPLASVQQLLKPEFRISRSYFIPADKTPVIPADVHMVTLDLDNVGQEENAWDSRRFPALAIGGYARQPVRFDQPGCA
jgi:hypothetical protein